MRVKSILSVVFSCTIALSEAASSWGLSDATISVQGKGAGAGGGFKDKLSDRAPLSKPVSLGHSETLKILLTATEDKKGKRPHQLFLLVTDTTSGLETSFPFSAKDSGKGKLELMQKDFPAQFLAANSSLQATVIIASFGASKPINKHIFNLNLIVEPGSPASHFEAPLRYGKRDEIHHTFRGDPKSPPMIISIFFTLVVLATVPVLYGTVCPR
ncbi:MAG: hypothetical protein M1829_000009 [Trizodia sp. TS-e1964]|nr:MAG: hypothetical protein M1829_000009 [Trizodia sp. TS-e1964]